MTAPEQPTLFGEPPAPPRPLAEFLAGVACQRAFGDRPTAAQRRVAAELGVQLATRIEELRASAGLPVSSQQQRVEALIREIRQQVAVHYEPRNPGMEWTVSLPQTATEENPLPIHEHFGDLVAGLEWLARHAPDLLAREKE